jgi:hypothetical protein
MTEETTYALDAMRVRALREADTIVFRHPGLIECAKKLKNPTPWEDERSIAVPAKSTFTYYGKTFYKRASYMLHSSQFDREWQTVARLVKPGDELELEWIADNTSQFMDARNLTRDECRLHIVRGGKWALSFNIGVEVNDPGSLCRMVKVS